MTFSTKKTGDKGEELAVELLNRRTTQLLKGIIAMVKVKLILSQRIQMKRD